MKNKILTAGLRISLLIGLCVLVSPRPYASEKASPQHISPEFNVRLLDETTITFKDIQNRVTVIDFWGTWCKPCLAEIPDYSAFYRDYKDKGVLFFALAHNLMRMASLAPEMLALGKGASAVSGIGA